MLETFAGCEVIAESDRFVLIDTLQQGPWQLQTVRKRDGALLASGRFSFRNDMIDSMFIYETRYQWSW